MTAAEPPIRVLVADDELIRGGIGLILSRVPGVEVVAEAVDGQQAIDLTARHRPHVVLLDIKMPVLDGLAALPRIRAGSSAAVIVLTTFGEAQYIAEAVGAGAAGFVLKSSAAEELEPAIRAAASGEAFLSPPVTRQALSQLRKFRPASAASRLAQLTEREHEVLVSVGRGLSNTAISEELFISESTVKTHVSRILLKLECENREAALLVHQAGLLR